MVRFSLGWLTVCSVVIAGCGGDSPSNREEQAAVKTNTLEGPFASYPGEDEAGDSALLKGVLIESEGCLYVQSTDSVDDTITTHLPVFPGTTTWDEQTKTLTVRGISVAVGQPINLGGGEIKSPRSMASSFTAPTTCNLDILGWSVYRITP